MSLKIITSKSNPKIIIDTARELYRERPADGDEYSETGVMLSEGNNGEQSYVVFTNTFHDRLAKKGFVLCKQGSKNRMEGAANLKRALTTAQRAVRALLSLHQLPAQEIDNKMKALENGCVAFVDAPKSPDGTDWATKKESLLDWLDG